MLKSLRIGTKTNVFIGVVLTLILCMALAVEIANRQIMPAVASTRIAVDMMSKDYIRLSTLVHSIRLHVVQVQQFLTDVSATRGLNGLDDGPAEAAEHAKAFKADASEAKKLAQTLHDSPATGTTGKAYMTQIIKAIEAAEASFPAYYATGQRMSSRYIAEGPDGGNQLMSAFDATSERIQNDLGTLGTVMIDALADEAKNEDAEFDRIDRILALSRGVMLAIAALGFILMLGTARLIRASVVQPLLKSTDALRGLANQDLTVEAPVVATRDEIGDIVTAIASLRDQLLAAERLRAEQEDLRQRAEEAQLQALQKERDAEAQRALEQQAASDAQRAAVSNALQGMAEAIEQELIANVSVIGSEASSLRTAASELTDASSTVTASSRMANDNAQNALGSAEAVAAAAEEMSAAIDEISRQVQRSACVSRDAVNAANQTRDVITGLVSATQDISAIVDNINQIADQTNLLALNATIESARAGEAGRGFAVVASEVKSLAGQTTKLTESIRAQVTTVQAVVDQAVGAIDAINRHITDVDESSSMIAASIEQQSVATREIASSVQVAATAVAHVVDGMDTVRENAERSTARAEALNSTSAKLSDSTTRLREELIKIVRTVVPEVDRRSTPRSTVHLRGTLHAPHGQGNFMAQTLDLSPAGARISLSPAPQNLPDSVSLSLADVPGPVPARVIELSGDTARLAFTPSPEQHDMLKRISYPKAQAA